MEKKVKQLKLLTAIFLLASACNKLNGSPRKMLGGSMKLKNPLVLLAGASKYDGSDDLEGVPVDVKTLYDLFTYKYGYSTFCTEKHLKKSILDEFLSHFLGKTYHEGKNHDAIIFVLLGHGGAGSFVSSDRKKILKNDIWKRFKGKNLPESLKECPRLLFSVACRGGGLVRNDIKEEQNNNTPTFNFDDNMGIVYGNTLGLVVRDTHNYESGSWFVRQLNWVLKNEKIRRKNMGVIIDELRESIREKTKRKECVEIGGTLSWSKIYLNESPCYWNVIKPVRERYKRGINELQEIYLGYLEYLFGVKDRLTPLGEAVLRGETNWIEKICSHPDCNFVESKINILNGYYLGMERGDEKVLLCICRSNANKNEEKDWKTPSYLMDEVASKSLKEIKEKGSSGINEKERKDWKGHTGLTKAADEGNVKRVREILSMDPKAIGARVGGKGSCAGYSALHLAAELGKKEVLEVILRKCPKAIAARVGVENQLGWAGYSALEIALDMKHTAIARLLESKLKKVKN